MQIVIDIPEEEYEVILNNNYVAVCACPHLLSKAIKNGTPLPKGHGRLIDFDSAIDKYWDGIRMEITAWDLNDIPTVIEAEKNDL